MYASEIINLCHTTQRWVAIVQAQRQYNSEMAHAARQTGLAQKLREEVTADLERADRTMRRVDQLEKACQDREEYLAEQGKELQQRQEELEAREEKLRQQEQQVIYHTEFPLVFVIAFIFNLCS